MHTVETNCPTCHKIQKWDLKNQFRPFCSNKCKLIDLGEWVDERYSIPVDAQIDN